MNMRTNSCPCCGGALLRHVRHAGVYWFCTSCWQEVPLLSVSQLPPRTEGVKVPRPKQPVNS